MAILQRSQSADGSASLMPALLCVVGAILLWLAADDLRERLAPLTQQIRSAETLAKRAATGPDNEAFLRQTAESAAKQRTEIEKRLLTEESSPLVRARMVYDLRQRCAAALAQNCSVRLSEDSPSQVSGTTPAPTGAGIATPKRPPVLDDLGIVKSRAVIYGSFQNTELVTLANGLTKDPTAHWRINGLVVKGNVFELDVERHLRQQSTWASAPVRQP
jgi:hypothetical protein